MTDVAAEAGLNPVSPRPVSAGRRAKEANQTSPAPPTGQPQGAGAPTNLHSTTPYEQLYNSLNPAAQQHASTLGQTLVTGAQLFHNCESTSAVWKEWDTAKKGLFAADESIGKNFDLMSETAKKSMLPLAEAMRAEYAALNAHAASKRILAWGQDKELNTATQQPWFAAGALPDPVKYKALASDDAALRLAFAQVASVTEDFHKGTSAVVAEFNAKHANAATIMVAPTKIYHRAWSKQYEYLREHKLNAKHVDSEGKTNKEAYREGAAFILDLERCMVVMSDPASLADFIEFLPTALNAHAIKIVRVKNRFALPAAQAAEAYDYRDLLLNVEVKGVAIAELQVTTKAFYDVRKQMHAFYDVLRCPKGDRGARRILEDGYRKANKSAIEAVKK